MADATETVRPFSCGTQYADWTDANCIGCRKAARVNEPVTCDIEKALIVAYMDDGRIPLAIADRMGRDQGRYNWPCMEHDPPFVNVRVDGTVDPNVRKESQS